MTFFKKNPGILIQATNILDNPVKVKRKVSKPKFEIT